MLLLRCSRNPAMTGAVLAVAIVLWASVGLPVARAESDQAPTPFVTNVVVEDWSVGAGLVYWADHCFADEFNPNANLRRRPSAGGPIRLLASINDMSLCNTFLNPRGSDDGFYYYDDSQTRIARMPLGEPYTAQGVKSLAPDQVITTRRPLVEAGGYLYWLHTFFPDYRIYRTLKNGSGPVEIVATTAAGASDLLVVGQTVFWTDGTGVYATTTNCATLPCGNPLAYQIFGAGTSAYGLVYQVTPGFQGNFRIYWVQRVQSGSNATYTIHYRACNAIQVCYVHPGPPPLTFYTATVNWRIGQPLLVAGNLYWTEVSGNSGEIRRAATNPLPPAVQTIAIGQGNNLDAYLYAASDLLFFARMNSVNGGIYTLPLNAEAIRREFAIQGMEVTQAIQNLAGNVPLVAGKTTYVRVYAVQTEGPSTPNVEAHLVGMRGGNHLPGSPLQPVNSARSITTGASFDRARLDDGWYFLLPESWTAAGNTSLTAIIDPRLMHNDTNRGNNELNRAVQFQSQPPVCVMTVPVRTHTPLPSTNDPNFWGMISHFDRRWPVPTTWVFRDTSPVEELEGCWWGPIPHPCFGPYELEDGWSLTNGMPDRDKVIVSLWARALLTYNPDACDDIGAPVHFMGMVHPEANNGGASGYASTISKQSWVQLPGHAPNPAPNDWNAVRAGQTMAQELAHNFGRKHVNCGNPDDIDTGYPFPPCQIANTGAANHYGFDTITRQPIRPDQAADFMSYGWDRWVSSYTWNALFNAFASSTVTATPLDADQGDSVFISGVVDVENKRGALGTTLVMPTASIPPSTRQLLAAQAVHVAHGDEPHATYSLRMLDPGGGIVISHTLTLLALDDHVDDGAAALFAAVLPAPAQTVATIQLLADGAVIDSRNPGVAKPTAAIQEPVGGTQISNTLTLNWTASDSDPGDRLLFTVQYSHNNGASWHTLALNRPGPIGEGDGISNTLRLNDLGTLRGSAPNQARIRVLANDGYNTAIALSAPFTVQNRSPQPVILVPVAGQVFPAADGILLQGSALDPEDGGLSGNALRWQVDGSNQGTGATRLVAGLAPGAHTAALVATDSNNQTVTATVSFNIAALAIPLGSAPVLNGRCDDAAYVGAAGLRLRPYADGAQANVQLLRTPDHLWLCFSGLRAGNETPGAFVGVRVDVDNSRNPLAQTTDVGFFVGEDGGVFTRAGDGVGGFNQPGPGGLTAQVSRDGALWSAELRIERARLNDWGHLAGFDLRHYRVDFAADDYAWPFAAVRNRPDTWGTVVLGDRALVRVLTPGKVIAQGPAFTLHVTGTGFISGTVVRWNNNSLSTTFVNSEHLTAQVGAGRIGSPGTVQIRARTPDGFDSNVLPLFIVPRTPVLASLSPNGAGAGSGLIVLEVQGQHFAPDVQVLWNGTPLTTQFVSATRATAQLPAALLANGTTVGIAVRNPSPVASLSNLLPFNVLPPPPDHRIYLPAMRR